MVAALRHDLPGEPRPEQRDLCLFELWLFGRLEGNTVSDHWLDQFDLYASAQFCFALGRAAIATKLPKWHALRDDQQWWSAGEATSLDAFAYSQGLRPSELLTFARRNDLSCQQARGPRGGAQLRMTATDREAFHDRFISFRTLGAGTRLGWSELQARLDADGIRPAGGSA